MKYSKNPRAEKLLGLRPEGIPIDQPEELGYQCPIEYLGKRNGRIKRICKICNKEFIIYKSELKRKYRNPGIFCSKRCKGLWMSKQNLSEEHKKKIGEANKEENNGMWKGDEVNYAALHEWVGRRLLKPKLCEICKLNKPYDLSNRTGIYNRNLENWWWLCRSCHMKWDYQNGFRKNKKTHSLEWSEYKGMIWCRVCDFDYPSPLCMPDPKDGTEIFLDIIEEIKKGEKDGE